MGFLIRVSVLLFLAIHAGTGVNTFYFLSSSTPSPQIYYYSSIENAFFIENLDNQERYVLTEYSADPQTIAGPGWSPSGNWFVWIKHNSRHQKASPVFVVDRSGENRQTFLENIQGTITYLAWSPVVDHLLIGLMIDDSQLIYKFIDPQNQSVAEIALGSIQIEMVDWLADGETVALYYHQPNPDDSVFVYSTGIAIIGPHGLVQEHKIFLSECGNTYKGEFLDPYIIYMRDQHTLAIADSTHENVRLLDMPDGIIEHIEWQDGGSTALILTRENCNHPGTSRTVWLLDASKNRLELINEDVQFARWIGPRLMIYDTENRLTLHETDHFEAFVLLNNLAGTLQPLIDFAVSLDQRWIALSLMNTQNLYTQLYLYDVQTGESQLLLDESNLYLDELSFSPSGKYLALNGQCSPGITACIFNLSSNKLTNVAPHSETEFFDNQFIWYPEDDRLFVAEAVSPTMRLPSVVKADNQVRQELPLCSASPSCFGWLPNLVVNS